MTPTREDTEVITVPAPTRENEIPCHASYPSGSGRHIWTGTWFRPVVVEQTSDGFTTHLIGLNAPMVPPAISEQIDGTLLATDSVFFARYDSSRRRYSELSPAAVINITEGPYVPVDPGTPDADTLDSGIPLGIDLVYGTYDVRTAIMQRGVLIPEKYTGTYQITIRLRMKKVNEEALRGNLRVRLFNDIFGQPTPASAGQFYFDVTIPASAVTSTDEFQDIDFTGELQHVYTQYHPRPYTTITAYTRRYILGLEWSSASVQPGNCILVDGYYDSMVDTVYDVETGILIAPSAPARNVVSINRTGIIALVNSPGHGFLSGETVTIAGAGQAEYNGAHEVTVIDEDNFEYEVSGSPATPATGTITATSTAGVFYPTFEAIAQAGMEAGEFAQTGGSWIATAEFRGGRQMEAKITDIPELGNVYAGTYQPNISDPPYPGGPSVSNPKLKYPQAARINSGTETFGTVDGTFNGNVYGSSLPEVRAFVTNQVLNPETLVGNWLRIALPGHDTTKLAFFTGYVQEAGQDYIVFENWVWYVGGGWTDGPATDPTKLPLRNRRSESNLEATGRIAPQAGDSVTGSSPDATRDFCYSVIGGISTQDIGPLSFNLSFGTLPPTIDGGQGGGEDPGGGGGGGNEGGGAGDQRGYVVSNLALMLGDEATDDYDSLVPVIYSSIDGEFYEGDPLPIASITADYRLTGVNKTRLWTPGQNFVPPSWRVLKTYSNEGSTRLMGVGTAGWDAFVDMPRLEYLEPGVRMTSLGVVDFTPTDVSIYRNGQFIVTAFDADGNELVRGFIYGAGTSSPANGLDGAVLTATQIQVCSDFARSVVITSDGDASGDFEGQRWEFRRQVVASVLSNSDRVRLFYDADLTVEAEVASQAWNAQVVSISGAPSTGRVLKVATQGGTYSGSLNSDKTVGTEIVLLESWQSGSATGLLTIVPRTKEAFFNRAGYYDWESTGYGYSVLVQAQTAIRTFALSASTPYLVCEMNELFTMSPSGFIVDPNDFVTAAGFDIATSFSTLKQVYAFSCSSTATWTWPTQRVGWIGSEGPRSYNGAEVESLFAGKHTKEWSRYDRRSLQRVVAAVDPQHTTYPCVRLAGAKIAGGTNRDRQLAILYDVPSILNFSEDERNFDVMIPVLMEDGSIRIMFGGNSRMFLYGAPTQDGEGIFLTPYVGGTQTGTMTDSTYEGDDAVVDSTASFNGQGEGYIFTGSKIRVAKIDDFGAVEWATAVEWISATVILVEPDDDWTFTAGRVYKYIIGARYWEIELPQVVAPAGTVWSMVQTEAWRIDMLASGAFDWPINYKVYGSGDSPDIDRTVAVCDDNFLKSELTPMHAPKTLQIGRDYTQVTVWLGVSPPDCTMTFRSGTLTLGYSGG